jgi:hypothetical protein
MKTKTLGNSESALSTVKKAGEGISNVVVIGTSVAIVGVVGYFVIRSYQNRFIKKKEISSFPQANVSFAQAESRANAIYSSIGWFTNDFENVKSQLVDLNYNGYARVYNAFKKRRGTLFAGELNLEDWLYNQFTKEQLNEISFLLNGAFFRQKPVEEKKALTDSSLKRIAFTGV